MTKLLLVVSVLVFGLFGTAHSECENVGGTWQLDNTIQMADCGEPDSQQTVTIEIKQNGCDVVLDIEGAVQLDGKVSNNVITIDDSYEDEGTIYKELELKVDGDKMTGGGGWLWDSGDDELSCAGTESFDGARAG